jgi:hypothetical protein
VVAHENGRVTDGHFRFDTSFSVTRANQWCRVAINTDMYNESSESAVTLSRTNYPRLKYHLQISEPRSKKVLIDEKRYLTDFIAFMTNRITEISSLVKEHTKVNRSAEQLPVLEFAPPHSGEYRITLDIPEKEEKQSRGSHVLEVIKRFDLVVREGVVPMKARAYPHNKIDLRRKHRTRQGKLVEDRG